MIFWNFKRSRHRRRGGKYLDECKVEAKKIGRENQIHFLEEFHKKNFLIYQGAFAFCFPSFFEGFGIR